MDLTYRLPCIVHPPALMPGHEVLSIFPSVYFFSFFFYMKLLIRLEFILTSGGELQSTYLAHSNLLSQAVSSPSRAASSRVSFNMPGCSVRHQKPGPPAWEHRREAASAKVRESWHTAGGSSTWLTTPQRPEAVSAP